MSDLLHEEVPDAFIGYVWHVMAQAGRHTFQVLTKRPERLAALEGGGLSWPENVWMGVSVKNADYLHRVDLLRECGAAVKFLSLEPLLGPLLELNLEGID